MLLTVQDLSGNVLGVVSAAADDHAVDLKVRVSALDGTPLEVLQVVGPAGEQVRGRDPLWVCMPGLQHGDRLTRVRLPVPEGFDVVGDCDSCDDLRHLFYGYTGGEAVLALCAGCGGHPEQPSDGSDMSV